MHFELDLHIHRSNDCDRGLFYLLIWIAWCKSSSLRRCFSPFIALGSTVSKEFYWSGVDYRWLLRLRPASKTFHQRHPLYSLGVVQSISRHCISRRCSSHMVCDTGVEWWRILMMIAWTSLLYVKCFKNPRIWQKLNVVDILF